MKINADMLANTVSSKRQVNNKLKVFEGGRCALKVLFLGNSITLHEPAPQIGWESSWGMAASCEEKDYVHILLRLLREKYGEIGYCICNVAEWERDFDRDSLLENYRELKNFQPNIIIARLGENIRAEVFARADFYTAYQNFLQYFAGNDSKIIVTDLFWENQPIDEHIQRLCRDFGYTFVHIGDLGYKAENKALGLFEHEGIQLHPGDKGMQEIANRIWAVLK